MNSAIDPTLDEIALVTVTFNSASVVNLFSQSARFFRHAFLIDNASTDKSPELFQAALPDIQVMRQPRNLGFGAANNIGFAKAQLQKIPYVLFLNPDAAIERQDILVLKNTLESHPNAAMASPAMRNQDGSLRAALRWDFTKPFADKSPEPISIDALNGQVMSDACIDGSCFLVRTDMFAKAGAFTDDLFLYCEEEDVNQRIARAGHASLLNPQATCMHLRGGSTPPSFRVELRKAYSARWSRLFMTDRYVSSFARFGEALRVVLVSPIAVLLFSLTLNRQRALRWLGWGLAGLDGLLLTKFFRRWL